MGLGQKIPQGGAKGARQNKRNPEQDNRGNPGEVAGQDYDLRYLGELLQTVGKPQLIGQNHSLPVICMGLVALLGVRIEARLGERRGVALGLLMILGACL